MKFITHYVDLLKSIKGMQYEAIEQICEEQLTEEIGAKIYEHTTFNNIQFRIINENQPVEVVDILNHFYVKGMSINRKENESLSNFKMLTSSSKDTIQYVPKGADDEKDEGALSKYLYKE